MASDKAFRDEDAAYKAIKKKLGDTATVFQQPAGAAAGFPDFGFVVSLPMGKVALHIEYKNSAAAQMGSMRDWIFDGSSFSTNDTKNEEKKDLLYIMNNTQTAINNGKRLLMDLQTHCTKDIKSISSGALTVIKDQTLRRAALTVFADKTKNYQIANITDATLGNGIISHYKNKFKKSKNDVTAKGHVLLMMIKDELWYVDKIGVDDTTMSQIAGLFGVNSINKLSGLTANLEVRIQPRQLNTPSKPVSIDVMASFRLKGKPTSGTKVI
tara:strand:+ start:50 stop:856 length:807 start_codon:yes stop_codon:yes gene_type:complete